MFSHLLQGFLLGIAYVAPIGMQNMYVLNSAVSSSKARAYLTALIVIFFDITLALACFYGVGLLLSNSIIIKTIIMGIGSLIVIYIGYSIFKSKPNLRSTSESNHSILKVVLTCMLVTWANPQALIDGSLLLGSFKLSLNNVESNYFIMGTCIASMLWFLSLTTFGTIFKSKLNDKVLIVINKICGIIIIFYGAKIGYNFISILGI